jgi:hypothetical protein
MNKSQSTCIIVAIAIVAIISAAAIYGNIMPDASRTTPNSAAMVVDQELPSSGALSARPEDFHEQEPFLLSNQRLDTNGQERKRDFVSPDHEQESSLLSDQKPDTNGQERKRDFVSPDHEQESLLPSDQISDTNGQEPRLDFASPEKKQAKLEDSPDPSLDPTSPKQDFSYLAYYAYAEVPPDKKPADTVLESFRGIPVGTPVEEIKRVSDAFGLDFVFMRAVAKIESDLNPKQRTGSYIGLFQLSKHEFEKYGSGNITDPRDNAVAAACKLSVETKLFELDTHKKATLNDIYLVHQQGLQGAAEHVNHPERIAWKSMCATDEGKERGEKWCKLAIWGNTLPTIKHVWKSVTKLTSGAFVTMWQQRVDHFYARYSEATAEKKDR